jgi:hypothetical protein
MTMTKLRTGLLVLIALGALWASGCGGGSGSKGKPLPAQQALALQRELDSVHRRFEFGDGACRDIQSSSKSDVASILASIPTSVSSDVRSSLRQSFDHLWQLASAQCDTAKNQPTTPKTTPPPQPTPTQPQTQTQTTPKKKPEPKKKPKEEKPKDNTGTGAGDTGGATVTGAG